MKLSVVIPVYNEKTFVEASLRGLFTTSLSVSEREVIVVDDGSTDGTREILDRLMKELPFQLVLQPQNFGKGAAIRKGISLATGDYIVFHDADLEYDPRDLNRMLEPLLQGKADVVYGSRFVGSEMRRLLFFWHQVGNRLLTLLVNMVTNLNFTDMETCYKMFHAKSLKEINLISNRFSIEPEITIKAAKRKLRFYEVAIAYNGRTYEQGKKINWKDGFSAIYHIFYFAFWKGSIR